MQGLEFLVFALVVLFYIIRAIYQGIKRLSAAARKAFGAAGLTPMEQRTAARQVQGPSPRPEVRPRRPEFGGPAVTGRADSAQFRAQMAQIEAQESPGLSDDARPAGADGGNAPPFAAPLFASGDDLVRAVILQEIFARPLSQRRRPTGLPPAS
ncbi:MAG: hypothetical protein JO250_06625 [Armatimonadetes bacterium]|nr:hypothetical protein [Armatimonadota bacterium]